MQLSMLIQQFTLIFKTQISKFCVLFLLLAVSTIIYIPGISGAVYYDDTRSLNHLTDVNDINSALTYLSTQTTGPLGRPITMATFLFNHNDWPNNVSAIFVFNILLHVFNGLLVFALTYQLLSLFRDQDADNFWPAIGTAALWLILPIHVSTTLIAIQRLAGLSAFFVFAGITIYLTGLKRQYLNQNYDISLQVIGLILFTLLAAFSKENGILLPVFILVLEVTLLAKITEINKWRNLRVFTCAFSLSMIVGYLLFLAIKSGGFYIGRNFNLAERLLTQPKILLEYLQLAFIPDTHEINPFHDNYIPITNLLDSNQALFAVFFWTITIFLAIYLRVRYPVFCFAVFWFLAAHLLESTSVGLELYFQHRNYVALLGPCFALIMFISTINASHISKAIFGFFLYWLLLVSSLIQTTQLWGSKEAAAHVWFEQQSGSERATNHLAIMYLEKNDISRASIISELQTLQCPNCIGSRAFALFTSCIDGSNIIAQNHFRILIELANTERTVGGAPVTLAEIHRQIVKKNCTAFTLDELKLLNISLMSIINLKTSKSLLFLKNIYSITVSENNTKEAINILYRAWGQLNDIYIAHNLISHLLEENRYREAHDFVKFTMCKNLPINPILSKSFISRCKIEKNRIEETITKIIPSTLDTRELFND